MKEKECAIVQDLLVLYEDNVLHEESRQMVEEHIRGCEECMKIYENGRKDLKVSDTHKEPSEEDQADQAARIMKKFKKRMTFKSISVLGVILAVIILAVAVTNEVCNRLSNNNWGIIGMVYTIPTDQIKITELYRLKNGDIYCTLESDKKIGIYQYSDFMIPEDEVDRNTEDASLEICFRQLTPWESGNHVKFHQMTAIFSTERLGVQEESGKEFIQRCSEIRYRGKTESDCMTIWKRGQKVEEAPEEIERKAIAEYVRNDQIEEAVRECENLGWDSGEEIVKIYREDLNISHTYSIGYDVRDSVVFSNNYETILLPQSEEH